MTEGERIQIIISQSPQHLLRLHPSCSRQITNGVGLPLQCTHGDIQIMVPWTPDVSVPVGKVEINWSLAERLDLNGYSSEIPARLTSHELRVGPLVGILCHPRWESKKGTLKNSSQLPSLKKLLEAGKKNGALCYLFSIEDVNFDKMTVKAFLCTESGWKRKIVPMPDAIYDQVISRKIERDEKLMEKRQTLSRLYGNRIFNDGFFDKWQVHVWLSEDPKMKPYLLETVRHTTTQDAVQFVQKHQTVFLKPLHGSLGLGIARLSRNYDGSYVYELKKNSHCVQRGKMKGAHAMVKLFEKRLKARPYLWQQGITLLTYKERPVDIRILMQRDHTGEWKRTKMFARVAKSGDFTSNLSSGGEAMPLDEVLAELYPQQNVRRRCRRNIVRVSKLTTQALEKQSGKAYGELGIDIGLDKAGGIWVIELTPPS